MWVTIFQFSCECPCPVSSGTFLAITAADEPIIAQRKPRCPVCGHATTPKGVIRREVTAEEAMAAKQGGLAAQH